LWVSEVHMYEQNNFHWCHIMPYNKIKNLTFMVPCIKIYSTEMTSKMQQCRIIYCSLAALHVSRDIFAHHQEHLNGIYSFWYYTRVVAGWFHGRVGTVPTLPWNQLAMTHVDNTRSCKYSLDAPDDERKYRSKHVEQPRNNKLSYTVASCWSFSYNKIKNLYCSNICSIMNSQ